MTQVNVELPEKVYAVLRCNPDALLGRSFSPGSFAAAMYSATFLYRVFISGSLTFFPIMIIG